MAQKRGPDRRKGKRKGGMSPDLQPQPIAFVGVTHSFIAFTDGVRLLILMFFRRDTIVLHALALPSHALIVARAETTTGSTQRGAWHN